MKFPDDILATLKRREWDNLNHLRRRLLGERPFPIECKLSPPSGSMAIHDLSRFQQFIDAWRRWPWPQQVQYQTRQLHTIGQHRIPVALSIPSMQALIECLGDEYVDRSRHWAAVMAPLLALDQALYPALVRQLAALDTLSEDDAHTLATLLPKLTPGMGQDQYLRALPITGIHTKFIESHRVLISQLLDEWHDGAVSKAGGLVPWLGCRSNPIGWLYVRYLCPTLRRRLGGFGVIQIPTAELLRHALPGQRVVVLENLQSGLALPEVADTVVVCGGGQNLTWTEAPWLRQKQVVYWGDIDTWGFKLLSDARANVPTLGALMMDCDTLARFKQRMVPEPSSYEQLPPRLSSEELAARQQLYGEDGRVWRLEQERLNADYIISCAQAWASA